MNKQLNRWVLMALLMLFSNIPGIIGEGTKQLRKSAANTEGGGLLLNRAGADGNGFALVGGDADSRLFVRVADANLESVYMGFQRRLSSNVVTVSILTPDGLTLVELFDQNGISLGTSATLSGTVGFINDFDEAVAGPSVVDAVNGYNNFIRFNPVAGVEGDYIIQFSVGQTNTDIELFDITVVDNTNTAIEGRLWSKAWQLSAFDGTFLDFNADMFMYTTDSVVTKLTFEDLQPGYFYLNANRTGSQNTGDPVVDRRSADGKFGFPLYPIFLNDPDIAEFPSGISGSIVEPISVVECGSGVGVWCINVHVDKAAVAEILLDFDQNGVFDAGSDIMMIENLTAGRNCVEWDGTDGGGVPLLDGDAIDVDVTVSFGLTHLPLFDVEGNNGFDVERVRPGVQQQIEIFWDDTFFSPTALDLDGCTKDNPLATVCHNWAFSSDASSLGELNTVNTWWRASSTSQSVIYVVNTNCTPQPVNDTIFVDVNSLNNIIDIKANDIDPNGDPVTVQPALTGPTLGTATLTMAEEVDYSPPLDYIGTDQIIYEICDAEPLCNTATVYIIVSPDSDNDGIFDFVDLDDDNDGIPDLEENGGLEANGDDDMDGTPNYLDPQFCTGGMLANGVCSDFDFDGDGIPNHLDLDADNDGLTDLEESNHGQADANNDGVIDGVPADFGANGLFDVIEDTDDETASINYVIANTDGDTNDDYLDLDSDNDGLADVTESGGTDANGDGYIDVLGTITINPTDTDGDMVPDHEDLDSDNDGLSDVVESGFADNNGDGTLDGSVNDMGLVTGIINNDPNDSDGDIIPDHLDLDSDNDGLSDVSESGSTDADGDGEVDGTVDSNGLVDGMINSAPIDTDGDMVPDHEDLDSDNDGLSDVSESGSTDANGDGEVDGTVDSNGLIDGTINTNPIDTDGDMIPDHEDLDSDNDGLTDVSESGSSDVDGDGIADGLPDANGLIGGNINNSPIDTDGDLIPDHEDLDSDNDGLTDVSESGSTDNDGNGLVDGMADANGLVAGTINNDPIDTDGDMIPDHEDLDSDNDGLTDVSESGSPDVDGDGFVDGTPDVNGLIEGTINNDPIDTDGDMIPDHEDLDSDNDGLSDVSESGSTDANGDGMVDGMTDSNGLVEGTINNDPIDSDGDMIPDHEDLDSDNDGLSDVFESGSTDADGNGIADGLPDQNGLIGGVINNDPTDSDGDMVPDHQDLDSDNDGLSDVSESGSTDADGDGMVDGTPDANGLVDGVINNDPNDTDEDMIPDHQDIDSDNDGISDTSESGGTDTDGDGMADGDVDENGVVGGVINNDPTDSDGDMIPNYEDLDSDNDGLSDVVETGGEDEDGDGMVDEQGTITTDIPDSDDDGVPDYEDLDSDNDGLTDANETGGEDSDGDGVLDDFEDVNGDGMDDEDTITSDPVDSDGDGLPDYIDTDSDNDDISDATESGSTDEDGDGQVDEFMDEDGDGLDDNGGNADPADSNGDGIPDHLAVDNMAPVAGNDNFQTAINQAVSGNLTTNDSDPDNDELTFTPTPVSGPTNGTLTINPDGTFTYTPNAGFSGTDTFVYQVCDDGNPALCANAEVSIIIDPVFGQDLIYPNPGFSPNGDNVRDAWKIENIEAFPSNEVKVFNRWGNLVWEIKGYDNNSKQWFGESNNGIIIGDKKVPDGTYFFLIDLGDGSKPRSGYIIIKR